MLQMPLTDKQIKDRLDRDFQEIEKALSLEGDGNKALAEFKSFLKIDAPSARSQLMATTHHTSKIVQSKKFDA